MLWSYGVTTVPDRRIVLLPQTLESLKRAGFDNPILFVDNCEDPNQFSSFNLRKTIRTTQIRTMGNWALAAWELLIREPNADRYAIFQDDFVTYPGLRGFLELSSYPEKGYWNLYSFPTNEKRALKKNGWFPSDQLGKGAVGLVFSRQALLDVLTANSFLEKPRDTLRGWRSVDGAIITALKKRGYTEYVHYPSLIQHKGIVSATGNHKQPLSESFMGEDFNALRLL